MKSLLEHHVGMPLGRHPDRHTLKDLRLKNYLNRSLIGTELGGPYGVLVPATAPAAPNWSAFPLEDGRMPADDYDPLSNDVLGSCVFAAPGHMVNMIGQHAGLRTVVTADMVKSTYLTATGGIDGGYYIRAMLDQWLQEGLYGTQLEAYCAVDKNDPDEVAIALWLGCGLIGGYDLPLASQGQTDEFGRQLWDVPKGGWPTGRGPSTWGGHCIYVRGTSPGMDDMNSWGEDTEATTAWRRDCCSELYLPLVKEWRLGTGRAPNGFAYEDLLADVRVRA
jgi:hypothetical protein